MQVILRYSRFSPFARKVRVCAHELQLTPLIELYECNPHEDESLRLLNPLCKVPTLVLGDGTPIFDSRVICVYLSEIAKDSTIVPGRGAGSWRILRDEALGDGICDAAVALRGEKLRPNENKSSTFIARQSKAINAACELLAHEWRSLAARVDIGIIAIACALGYLDLRHPDLDWRRGKSELASWHSAFEARDSMNLTRATSTAQ